MESTSMKVLGRPKRTPWERFVRLQRTSAQLARGRGQPKGVYRFSSYEESEAWKTKLDRKKRT